MLPYIKSENLKFKRTFSRKFVFIAPLCIVLFAYLVSRDMPEAQKSFGVMAYNWWPLLFVPLGPALLCILSGLKDKKMSSYSSILAKGISKKRYWVSKIIIVNLYLLASNFILFVFFGVVNYLVYASFPNLFSVLGATLVSFMVSAGLTPINLLLQQKTSTIITLLTNFVGLLAGVISASKSFWFICPWGYALRLLCPILGIHPNGTFLPLSSHLWNSKVIFLGVTLAIVLFVIGMVTTTVLFDKEEGA